MHRPILAIFALALVVPFAAAQGPLPDLSVDASEVEQTGVTTATAHLAVKNEGDAATTGPFKVTFYLDFETYANVTLPALEAGHLESTTVNITGLTAGQHVWHTEIDPDHQLAQKDAVAHDKPISFNMSATFTPPTPTTTSTTPATTTTVTTTAPSTSTTTPSPTQTTTPAADAGPTPAGDASDETSPSQRTPGPGFVLVVVAAGAVAIALGRRHKR